MTITSDLRHALRSLRRTPAFTLAAVATLAIGIGANSAIFSLVDAVMWRPLPVPHPQELMLVQMQEPGQDAASGVTNAIWEATRDQLRGRLRAFAWSAALPFDLTTSGGVRQIDGDIVSGEYFPTLAVSAAAGRLFSEADDRPGCEPVAVLGFDFWQTQFGGSPQAMQSTLVLNRHAFRVVGVAARGFHGMETGRTFDVAVPVCASAYFDRRNVGSRNRWWLSIGIRLPASVTVTTAQAYLDATSRPIMEAAVPNGNAASQQRFLETRLVAAPLATGESILRRQFGTPLRVLMAAVVLVLLIACANIAGLMLARGTARSDEIAIRSALGASRRRLVRQLMTESLVIACAGSALGILLANAAARLLVRGLATAQYPVYMALPIDYRVIAFTVTIAVVAAVLVGLFPALRLTGLSIRTAINARRAAGTAGTLTRRQGAWIVATQIALSLVLVVSGGLLLRTFVNLVSLDPGFDRENLLVVAARAPWFAADTVTVPAAERAALLDTITERLRQIPGVISVARSFTTPIGDDNWVLGVTADNAEASASQPVRAHFNRVTPGYFQTLRTRLLAGRDFDSRDTAESAPVAIVNESFARRLFAGTSAIGRRFAARDNTTSLEVVGIVADSKYESLREVTPPTAFIPAAQPPRNSDAQEFVIRTSVPPASLVPTIQRTILQITDQLPLRFQTLDNQVTDSLARERVLAALGVAFGGIALLLAMIGLYGVLSYFVTQQRVEFGIRMAIGAQPASIFRLVLRDVLLVLAVGVGAGTALALTIAPLLQQLLFDLTPRDTSTIAGAVLVLIVTALVAAYVPARRATRVDPLIALRAE